MSLYYNTIGESWPLNSYIQPTWSYAPAPCEHCYCLKALNQITVGGVQQQRTRPHKRCCKCQDETRGKAS